MNWLTLPLIDRAPGAQHVVGDRQARHDVVPDDDARPRLEAALADELAGRRRLRVDAADQPLEAGAGVDRQALRDRPRILDEERQLELVEAGPDRRVVDEHRVGDAVAVAGDEVAVAERVVVLLVGRVLELQRRP